MRWTRWAALFALLTLMVSACGGGENGGQAEGGAEGGGDTAEAGGGEELMLGIVGPMTGDYANYGTDWWNAAQLAAQEINEADGCGGNMVQPEQADDQADPQAGVTVANQLVSQDMYALIGPIFSSVTLPVTEVTERDNIPSFNASSATEVTERDLNAVFRMAFRDDQAGPFDAQTAREIMGAQTAVVIHDNTAFALGLGEAFAEAFEEQGGEVLATEVINPGESDYSSTLTRVRDLNPDVVYYSGYFPEGGLLVRQGKELGIEKEGPGTGWLFGNSNFDPSFIEIAGDAAEGVLFGTWPSPTVDPQMAEYAEKYQQEFSEDPGALGHWAYDAIYVLCEAIQQAGTTDRQAVLDVLHSGDFEYEGVSGPISYDEKGDRSFPPLAVLTVEDGEFVVHEDA